MRYKHLFFDLDHTIWDYVTNARLTLNHLYHDLDLKTSGVHDFDLFYEHYTVHNDRLWDRFRKGYIRAEELRWKRMWHSLLEFRAGDEKLARTMSEKFMEHLPSRNILFPGAAETLQYLRDKGYNIHLITNGFETIQHHKLKNSGIDHFFIEVITSEGSNSVKPNKEIFEYALRKAGALSQESIMIGDNLEADIRGAMNAGLDQVFVNHECIECLIQPTYTVRSLKELQEIF